MSRELVNISQAAQRTGRRRTTIQSWVNRHKLFPVGLEHDNTPLYDLEAVRELAKKTPVRRRRRKSPGTAG